MAPVREVAFELERFEWSEERLEVAGRWKGLGQHRLDRPVLTVDTDAGRRKRIVAMPGGHMGVTGETWRASFAWPGDPAEISGAELEVGGNLVVDLPLPDRRRRRRRRVAADAHADEVLRAEVVALRGQVDRLRAELAGREREIIALRAQLDDSDEDEDAPAGAGADERTVEIQRLAGALERLQDEKLAGAEAMSVEIERLTGEVERLQDEIAAGAGALDIELERLAAGRESARGEIETAVAAERERWQADVDELRQAFADAAVEAEATRDHHRAEVAKLEDELRAERAQVARLSAALADPSTRPMPPPDEAAAGEPTEAMPPSASAGAPAEGTPGATIEAAVLDAPGPLRAGSRPASPPGGEDAPVHAPTRVSPGGADGGGSSAFHALKARFEGLFASNGHEHDDEPDEELAIPRPRRTAAAARARAEATVAARRSPGEVWGMRVLAAVVVAVLLIAFVLILASIA
ncbi:MAG TPA: hypothetical protein VK631_13560 [Solirubrobacteraceae bacterium]|nr:hypothetical protein [Solirubrobacteraceae bacterium]